MSVPMQVAGTAVLTAVLAAGWLWLSGWDDAAGSLDQAAQRPATPVLVEALDLAEDKVVLRVVGTGKALNSASIYPKVAGEVVEVLFEAEQRVEKGAPLVRLDDEQERLAVRLAQVAANEAERQVKRYEKLAPSGTVSVVSLETAQAELESARLRLAQARVDLRDRTVSAPFAGIIGLSEVEVGDRVTDETLIATLDDRTVILVEFTVPEEFAGRTKIGNSIAVRPWTTPDLELSGTISAVDSRIDRVTRSLRVRARIPNPDEALRPGTSFDVRLGFIGRPYPSVPEVAVLWSRDGAYLWRVIGSRAEKVFVKMVRRDRGQVLVDGPLQAGDLIVVEGVQGLRDGQLVDPRPFGDAGSGQGPKAAIGESS